MKYKKILDRIDQMHGAKINRMIWIAASQECDTLSELLEAMADNGELDKVLPGITEEEVAEYQFDHFALMVEFGYLGFIAELYFPTHSDFKFRTDGSVASCTINGGCCSVRYTYADTLDVLLDEMERQANVHFDEEVEQARRMICGK